MLQVVKIKFPVDKQLDEFLAYDLPLRIGDRCVVTTNRGVELGVVVDVNPTENIGEHPEHKVLRKATERDLQLEEVRHQREATAAELCKQLIEKRDLPMKLSRTEYLFDGSRVIFYFTSDTRVDFRVLVRDLARELRTRIEMRQIGARDEARMIGGLGHCGREENCSKLFLRTLGSVAVRTVKQQGLAMNPSRLTGLCGRLKCCLNFEKDPSNDKAADCRNCSSFTEETLPEPGDQ